MRRRLVAAALLPQLAACTAPGSGDTPPHEGTPTSGQHDGPTLTHEEVATARAVARAVVADQGASITSTWVIARRSRASASDTEHRCGSGRRLEIELIGDFPHTVTTGHAVPPGSPAADTTVRAMVVIANAESGVACVIGVQTAERGEPQAPHGSTRLDLDAP